MVVLALTAAALAGLMAAGGRSPGATSRSAAELLAILGTPGGAPPSAGAREYHYSPADPFSREPFCSRCHSSPPHRRSADDKAMLNHHASKLHCLFCHGRDFLDPGGQPIRKGDLLWPATPGGPPDEDQESRWRDQAARGRPCFPTGPACQDCHRRDGLLDFTRFGYDEAKQARLSRLEEFLTRSSRQKWYIPEIM